MIGRFFGPRALAQLERYLAGYWRTRAITNIDDQDADNELLEFALKWDSDGVLPANLDETKSYVDHACRLGLFYLVKRAYDRSQFRSELCATYLANLREEIGSPTRNWFWIVGGLEQRMPEIDSNISAVAQDCVVRGCVDEFPDDMRESLLRRILLTATRSLNLSAEFVDYIDARSSNETNFELTGQCLAILIWSDPILGVLKANQALEKSGVEMRQETA